MLRREPELANAEHVLDLVDDLDAAEAAIERTRARLQLMIEECCGTNAALFCERSSHGCATLRRLLALLEHPTTKGGEAGIPQGR
jgi:hypothetical protein